MAASTAKLLIVGIGDDGLSGLTESARRQVAEADVVLGAEGNLAAARGSVGVRRIAL